MNAQKLHTMNEKPTNWTPQEWDAIQFYAAVVRQPRALPGHRLTAQGAARYSARRLKELALQTEIRAARHA